MSSAFPLTAQAKILEARAVGEWYRAGVRRPWIRCRGLAVAFDPTFPPSPGGGWERVPAGWVGPPMLTLLGVPLRWAEYPLPPRSTRALPSDPDAWYDGRPFYASDVNAYTGARQIRSL